MQKMLGLLRKALTTSGLGVLAIFAFTGCCQCLVGSDAESFEALNDHNKLRRIEFELARGLGTRAFGGTHRHDLTLAGIKYEQAFIAQNRRFLDNLRWNVSLFSGARDHPAEAFLIGLNPGLRYYVPYRIGPLRPFVAGSAGAMATDIGRPDLGSKFQFNEQIGLGFDWELNHQSSIKISYRFIHISNAGFREPNRGVNAHLFVLAWSKSL